MSDEAHMEVGPGTEREYVTLGRRALAALLDNSVWLFAYLFFFSGVVAALYEGSEEAGFAAVVVYASLWFNYFSFCEWRWGQTIGKNATGSMVVTADGGRLSFGQASMRNLLRLVDWLVIGWVMIASSDRKQRLGDRVAKTVVVRRPKRTGSTMVKAPELAARQIAGGAEPPPVEPPKPEPEPGLPAAPPIATAGEARLGDPARAPEKRPGIRGSLPQITWNLKDTIWGLVGGIVLALISPIIVVPFDPDLESDGALLVAQAIFAVCIFVVPVGIAAAWSRSRLSEAWSRLGFRRFAATAIGWTLLAMFLYYLFAGLFSELILQPEQDDIAGDLGVGDESLIVAISAVLLIAVVAPISEEIFFRGFFYSGLRSRMTIIPAAIISGIVFGLPHAPTGLTAVVPLAVLGGALCWLYEKTGSLWPPIAAHMLNNGLALLILTSDSGTAGLAGALP